MRKLAIAAEGIAGIGFVTTQAWAGRIREGVT
jgi:hypothetical protein